MQMSRQSISGLLKLAVSDSMNQEPQVTHTEILTAVRENNAQVIQKLTEIEAEVQGLRSAFPGDDPAGHRRYHDQIIEWREQRTQFIRELLLHVAKVGVIGGLAWLLWGLWRLIVSEVHK